MRIEDEVRKTVVFVGVAHDEGFEPYGTAFVLVSHVGEQAFQTIVTAKHVVDLIRSHKKQVSLRVNTWNDGARVLITKDEHWFSHPNPKIDVSVCGTVISREQFDILNISLESPLIITDEIIKERAIGIGSDVYIAGMYIQRIGEAKNLPIVRTGTIAAMPEEKIETAYGFHDAYLVELRSLGGLSGSPVFTVIPPVTHKKGVVHMENGQVEYLLGMLLGHNNLQDQRDSIEIKNPNKGKASDPDLVIAQVPLNTGIGIVLPLADVIEAVQQPILKELRDAVLKRNAEKSTFVADAGPSQKTAIRAEVTSSPADDENPTH
jgi:hypothetical protein